MTKEENLYSEPIRRIISSPLSWPLRWGIPILVLTVCLILMATHQLKVKDKLVLKLSVKDKQVLLPVRLHLSYRDYKLLVDDGKHVKKDQILAIGEHQGPISIQYDTLKSPANGVVNFINLPNDNQKSLYGPHVVLIINSSYFSLLGEAKVQKHQRIQLHLNQQVKANLKDDLTNTQLALNGRVKRISSLDNTTENLVEISFVIPQANTLVMRDINRFSSASVRLKDISIFEKIIGGLKFSVL